MRRGFRRAFGPSPRHRGPYRPFYPAVSAAAPVGEGENLRGEEGGVFRPVDRDGRDRDARRHLHRRQQGVQPVEGRGFHRDADDRQDGVGGEHPREMRGLARGGDNDAEAVLRRPRGECRRLFRGPVGAHHMCLHRDAERFQGVDGFPHDRKVAVTAHDDRHFFGILRHCIRPFFTVRHGKKQAAARPRHSPLILHVSPHPCPRRDGFRASSHKPDACRRPPYTSCFHCIAKPRKLQGVFPLPAKFVELEGESEADTGDFVYFADLCRLPKKFRIFSLGFTPSIVYNVV